MYTLETRNNVRRPGLGLRVLGDRGIPTNGLRVGDALVVRSSVVAVLMLAVGQSIRQAMRLISLTLFGQVDVLGLVGQVHVLGPVDQVRLVMGVVLSGSHRVGINSWDLRFRVFWYDRFRRR